MTPEAEDYLVKASEDLGDARRILGIGLGKAAARGAYYVAFHAAEALLIERTSRIAKTHSGLRAALAQVLRDRPRGDRELLTFLAQAYKFKERSDYAVGPESVVTEDETANLIEGAGRFLTRVTEILGESVPKTS